jgi:hypothetical protein
MEPGIPGLRLSVDVMTAHLRASGHHSFSDVYGKQRMDRLRDQRSEAKRMNKLIIGMAPLTQGNIPVKIRDSADLLAGGSSSSLIGTVKYLV